MFGAARAMDVKDVFFAELDQRRESGYDVSEFDALVAAEGNYDGMSPQRCEELLPRLEATVRDAVWEGREPEELDAIRKAAHWPASHPVYQPQDYVGRLEKAWTGRVAGNVLGKPVENGDAWLSEVLVKFLNETGNWPVHTYCADVTPENMGFPEYRPCRSTSVEGLINGSSRDDDVDYTVLNLHLLLAKGKEFKTADVAAAWMTLLPMMQTYTAERATIRSIVAGEGVERARWVRNPYREWIGAAIRADVFGYVCPGDPAGAAELAYKDAVLSHTANGVYGEMWCAALVAAAFDSDSPKAALTRSLDVIPSGSRLYAEITAVMADHASGLTWEQAVARIQERTDHYSWVHTINNAGLLTAGLLYGDGSFAQTIGLTVAGGWDTDSNGATAGSVAALLGYEIPESFSAPLHDTVHSAVFGWDGVAISKLAALTAAVGDRKAADALLDRPLLDLVTPTDW